MSPGTAEFLSTLQTIYLAVELWAMVVFFVTRRFQRPSGNYLGVVLTLSFLTDAFMTLSVHFLHLGQTINAVANTYGLFEGILIILLYGSEASRSKKLPWYLLSGAYALGVLLEMFVFRGPMAFPGTTRSVLGIIITIFALLHFFKLVRDLPSVSIFRVSMFWINGGMLIYFSGNLFLFAMADYLIYVLKDNMILYWSSHNFLGIVSYTFFAIALWQARRNSLQSPKSDLPTVEV